MTFFLFSRNAIQYKQHAVWENSVMLMNFVQKQCVAVRRQNTACQFKALKALLQNNNDNKNKNKNKRWWWSRRRRRMRRRKRTWRPGDGECKTLHTNTFWSQAIPHVVTAGDITVLMPESWQQVGNHASCRHDQNLPRYYSALPARVLRSPSGVTKISP